MKKLFTSLAAILLARMACGQIIVSDNYNVAANGIGFGLNMGVNSGINPPTTRLTGTAVTNLRYILTTTTKTNTAFSIASNKLRVASAANSGRFSLSADGTTPFNFASALGTGNATPQNRIVYDLAIRMANNSAGVQRFSFALGVAEGDATTWDFGIQVYRTADSDDFYTIGKRIDIKASGLGADLNSFITNTAVGTYGGEISLLMRVTDAGNETNSFNSRIQLSLDGGFTWFYDTDNDSDLPSGWRLKGTGRYVLWDVASDAGNVTYDNFSLTLIPISANLVSPANNAQNLGAAPQLKTVVSNTIPGNLAITYYTREAPKPFPGPDFLIAVLPDTQNYAREAAGSGDATKEMWFSQTEWIITNRVSQNIAYVATLGDCVQDGDIFNGGANSTQWRNATNAMYRLEIPSRTLLTEGIPYGITVGNHDQEPNGDLDGTTTNYNYYFGTAHFSGRSYYGGHYSSNNDSWFDFFSASGMDFIVFSFEYGRYGSGILDWANDVLATNQNRRVIVLTHHAGDDNSDVNATTTSFSTQGSAIYEALKSNTNFFLMLGGHVFNEGGEGRRSDTFNGKTVRTLVSDYQGRFNGGNGLMRLMYFSPSNNLVSIKTYSPYTDNYETDANSQFSFNYNMQPNGSGSAGTPWVAIGTNMGVVPGTTNTFVWSDLQTNKTYEWYVNVADAGGNTITSPSRLFTTGANVAPIASNLTVSVTGDQPSQVALAGFDSNGDAITFQTNSSPVHGFIMVFNSTNGAMTYQPLHGYRGLDIFTYHANDTLADSPIANFTLNVVSPPDLNSNGLPDSWEIKYGVTDPNADDDGDGQKNLAEYFANTNPTNFTSCLKILTAAFQTNGNFLLAWPSVGNTRYRIQYSNANTNRDITTFTDLVRPLGTETDPTPYGFASTQTFLDTFTQSGVPTNKTRYYRIKVSP
jgi:hypothetical protein